MPAWDLAGQKLALHDRAPALCGRRPCGRLHTDSEPRNLSLLLLGILDFCRGPKLQLLLTKTMLHMNAGFSNHNHILGSHGRQWTLCFSFFPGRNLC